MPLTYVTGPVRSGKSRFAASLAARSALSVTYVATAARDDADPEWASRIAQHAADRDSSWGLVESSRLSDFEIRSIFKRAGRKECLLVDSLGGWLSDRLYERGERVSREFDAVMREVDDASTQFAQMLLDSPALVIVVGEQTGWGIVPLAPTARMFRDVLGRLEQRLAARAAQAYLVVAGHALDLHALGRPV